MSTAYIEFKRPYTRNDEMYAHDGELCLIETKNGMKTTISTTWKNDHKAGKSDAAKKEAVDKIAKMIVEWIDRQP